MSDDRQDGDYMPVREAATALDLSPRTISYWCKHGKVICQREYPDRPPEEDQGDWLVSLASLREWLGQRALREQRGRGALPAGLAFENARLRQENADLRRRISELEAMLRSRSSMPPASDTTPRPARAPSMPRASTSGAGESRSPHPPLPPDLLSYRQIAKGLNLLEDDTQWVTRMARKLRDKEGVDLIAEGYWRNPYLDEGARQPVSYAVRVEHLPLLLKRMVARHPIDAATAQSYLESVKRQQ